jgi:hypothetical protein
VWVPGPYLQESIEACGKALQLLQVVHIDLCLTMTPSGDHLGTVQVAAKPNHAMFEGFTGCDVMVPLTTAKKARKE